MPVMKSSRISGCDALPLHAYLPGLNTEAFPQPFAASLYERSVSQNPLPLCMLKTAIWAGLTLRIQRSAGNFLSA